MKRSSLFPLFLLILGLFSCGNEDNTPDDGDSFDRKAMLTHWADNLITPALTQLSQDLAALQNSTNAFTENPTNTTLSNLRQDWLTAYLTWQQVAIFEVGQTEALRYREFMNIYPVDVTAVEANISNQNFELDLVSKVDEQGFPALDYLLHGAAQNDTALLALYQNSEAHQNYLNAVVNRMNSLTTSLLDSWNTSDRDAFVGNDGNTVSSSVNKQVNAFVKYYEKDLRAGKIGIPAGVFSGNPLPDRVEAYYQGDVSKELFLASLDAVQGFFEGKHFKSNIKGQSLKAYLDFLNTIKEGDDLSGLITAQFETARTQAGSLNANFASQVQNDNNAMLLTYDELQKNVVLLKVDMMQALNISVDYVDADGD